MNKKEDGGKTWRANDLAKETVLEKEIIAITQAAGIRRRQYLNEGSENGGKPETTG